MFSPHSLKSSHDPEKSCDFCQAPLSSKYSGFAYCNKCKVVYNLLWKNTEYEDSYFEREYKKQYGKSYLDDKPNIQKKMELRLTQFRNYISNVEGKKLLEIGSAAGFFLELVSVMGISAEGWEISKIMTDYANRQGFKTTHGDFLSLLKNHDKGIFDIIAAFYVIEHFAEQQTIWSGLSRLLKPGGFLLLALPSISGPSWIFHNKEWRKGHPEDHYVDLSIRGIKKVSSMFGFQLMHIGVEGIHPERFPLGNWFFLKNIFTFIQKRMGFGDTVFVILKKRI